MFSVAALRVLSIKDLKDLSVLREAGYYRHAGPKGPEEVFSRERSRGPVPRATGQGGVLLAMRRPGSGDPELRSLGHANDRGGLSPALRTNLANRGNRGNPAPLPAFSSYIRRPAHNTPRRITA